ncbi:MAG: ABC transporter permease [Chloroflexota bacterium]
MNAIQGSVRQMLRPERLRELSLVIIIFAVLLLFGTQIDNYFNPRFFRTITSGVMIIAVVVVGETLVILTRNIDLSVGSIVGCTAYTVGRIVADNNSISPLSLILIAIGMGALLGLLNGVLVSYGRVPAIVVTLGTLALFRGALVEFSGAKSVTTSTLPVWLNDLGQINLFSVGPFDFRILVVPAIVVVIVFQLVLSLLPYGRRLYAIGSNPEAARFAGMPARRIVMIAYVLCGALSGLAGFMFLARFGNLTVVAAQGMELQVVAAAVVGGVSTLGGSGTMVGALLGAILIEIIGDSLIRLRISEFWKDASLGVFILLAVASDKIILGRVRDIAARNQRRLEQTPTQVAPQPKAQKDSAHVQ